MNVLRQEGNGTKSNGAKTNDFSFVKDLLEELADESDEHREEGLTSQPQYDQNDMNSDLNATWASLLDFQISAMGQNEPTQLKMTRLRP